MLKWSRTPQQPRRSTVPEVSGEPNGDVRTGRSLHLLVPKSQNTEWSLDLEKEVSPTSGTNLTDEIREEGFRFELDEDGQREVVAQ